MRFPGAAGALLLLGAALLAGCNDTHTARSAAADRNHTSVLGSNGVGPQSAASAPLKAANGLAIAPPPGLPASTRVQMVRTKAGMALGVWVQDGHVLAATWTPAAGWAAAQPLEEIFGDASDPQLASDGRGSALAMWRHTVGSIESLRFSRFDGTSWSVPDVMPGALPRPRSAHAAAPRLRMDAQGNGYAEWPSGFAANEVQSARYVPGQGWSHATSVLASASNASPAPRPPSSAR